MSKSKKITYLILGLLSLVMAYIGVVMPGIPGTPFIILTAWFFIRSSDRLYAWLLRNKLFARIIAKFQKDEELSFKVKLWFIIPVLISAVAADVIFASKWHHHLIIGVLFTAYIILILLIKKIKI